MPGRLFTAVCTTAVFIALILCAAPVSADTGWMTEGVSENTTDALGGHISGDFLLYLRETGKLDQSQNKSIFTRYGPATRRSSAPRQQT